MDIIILFLSKRFQPGRESSSLWGQLNTGADYLEVVADLYLEVFKSQVDNTLAGPQ